MNRLECLNVKSNALGIAGRTKKTAKNPRATQGLACKPLCHRTKSHRFHGSFHIPLNPRFLNGRLVIEQQIQSR